MTCRRRTDFFRNWQQQSADSKLEKSVTALDNDAKASLKSELSPAFILGIPNVVQVNTLSKNREDYILHPASGEKLSRNSIAMLERLRGSWSGKKPNGHIVISDQGFGALSRTPGRGLQRLAQCGHSGIYCHAVFLCVIPVRLINGGNAHGSIKQYNGSLPASREPEKSTRFA